MSKTHLNLQILNKHSIYIKLPEIIHTFYLLKFKIEFEKLIDNNEDLRITFLVFDATHLKEISSNCRKIITTDDYIKGLTLHYLVINASDYLKSFISIIKLMYPNFQADTVASKEGALKRIEELTSHKIANKNVLKRWSYISPNGRYSYEIVLLENQIFISKPAGFITLEDSKQASLLFEAVLKETKINKYYRIQDYRQVESTSLEARRDFTKWLSLNLDHMELLVFTHLNKTMETVVKFGKLTSKKFEKVIISKTVEDGLQIIDAFKVNRKVSISKADTKPVNIPIGIEQKDELIKQLYEDNIKQQIEHTNALKNIFEIIGKMSWDNSFSVDAEIEKKDEHSDIYQAIKMVYSDLNHLIQKKDNQAIKIREKETQLSILLENIPNIAIYGVSMNGMVKYWNKAAEEIFGIKRTEINNTILWDHILFKAFADDIKKTLAEASLLHKSQALLPSKNYEYKSADGKTISLEGTNVLITKKAGDILYRIDVNQTLQKENEKEILEHRKNLERLVENKIHEIKKQEAQSRSILERAAQSIFVTKDFQFKYINPKGLDFFACTWPEIKSKKLLDFINQDDRQNFITHKENSDEVITVLRMVNNAHEERWVEISTVPIEWDGQISSLNFIIDITTRKNTEDQLLLAKQKAEEADYLKSSFLANMSHEIRTPLNAIIGFSQLLSEDEIPNDLKAKYYKLIDSNSKHLLDLIEDIIDISKIESGQITINQSYFNVNEFFKEIHLNFKETLKQHEKEEDVRLMMKLPIKSEGIFINSDRQRIKQVLDNLLGNALKFTKKGNIIMGYRMLDNSRLEFYVSDSGIGIHKEQQGIIFKRFHQLNIVRNSKAKGTGLGLAISKNIVELLGGQIAVESDFGKGATFSFTLPYKMDFDHQNIVKPRKNIPAFLDWSEKVILLAEDEESNYIFMKEALRRTKVQLIWVENGKEALDVLASDEKIDLVLMDIQMPEMDGYQALAKIKELGYQIPVIAQTAFAMVEDKEKLMAKGFDSYIAKPIQINILLETISEFLIV